MKNSGRNASRFDARLTKNKDANNLVNLMNNFYVPATTTEKEFVHYKYLLDQVANKAEDR
ncbi:hypothetical protein [Flammeovirga kamogawensis]|uniref:Uncharacterized protein n=1 Tax=Flammeovirga kamogawensis TaxID=373891 RepID=A0ABX8H2D6_9BACT|nr:hypothetical protein [Flammeovirga kamogawensis]MBB6463274.1 hypothetical protein [Flammeovirga kamogawensis]QWG09576.1 hypothetical protein KM029_23495 [Flammeovirga kamogawensis]TRX65090.1 hypothetical protein EO216_21390 [Flammeovirga kamogawensis]